MEVLILTSLIAAFLAGIAALFAPCCITVLLPSYLGSVFKEKHKVIGMTFVFFLGVLTVFLPIGLGFSALSQFFGKYHNQIFIVGGLFLFALGVMLLTKNAFSLPMKIHPALKNNSGTAVYVLGIFSAIATTCCAPVLAGVIALSVLPGSLFWGGMYTLMYVLGMVAPLFLIAAFIDKTNLTKKMMAMRSNVSYSLLGKKVEISIAEFISGMIFLSMGALTIYFAFMGRMDTHSDFQLSVNLFFAQLTEDIQKFVSLYATYVWLVLLGLAVWVIYKSIKKLSKIWKKEK